MGIKFQACRRQITQSLAQAGKKAEVLIKAEEDTCTHVFLASLDQN